MKKCRVLELIGGSLTDGGAETLVKDYVMNLDKNRFEAAVFVDWTISETANTKILTEKGELKNSIELDENGYVKHVIAHNGDIVPGYSGGPVLTKQGFRWYAIGVVSVTDKYVNKRFYSVPVIEIERMKTLK